VGLFSQTKFGSDRREVLWDYWRPENSKVDQMCVFMCNYV